MNDTKNDETGDLIANAEPWSAEQWFEEYQKVVKARNEDFQKTRRLRNAIPSLIMELRGQQAITNNWFDLRIKRLRELIYDEKDPDAGQRF